MYLTAKHGHEVVSWSYEGYSSSSTRYSSKVYEVFKRLSSTTSTALRCMDLTSCSMIPSLKPWIIEVNASPSLNASSPTDYGLKFGLLEDMLHIVDMEGRLSGSEKRVGEFDLILNNGPVVSDELALHCGQPLSYSTNSFLGCYNVMTG